MSLAVETDTEYDLGENECQDHGADDARLCEKLPLERDLVVCLIKFDEIYVEAKDRRTYEKCKVA